MFARTYAGEHHLRPYLSVNIISVSIYICDPKGAYVEDRVVCDVRVEMCTRLYTTAVPVNIMNTYISNRNLYGAYIMDTVVYHAAAVSYRFVFYVRPYCCTPFSSVNELHVCTYIYVSSPKGAHLDRIYITGTRFGTSTDACIYTYVVRNMYHSDKIMYILLF